MRVSIETLIDEGSVEPDGTEIFTRWRVLGTTVLNQPEAVVGANIRSLSAIGVEGLREMTKLRVASAREAQINPQTKFRKGVTRTMKLNELQPKFNGFTVVAVDGERVALLSDKGIPHISTATKDGDDYVVGAKTEVKANAVFENGEDRIEIPLESVADAYIARCNALAKELAEANTAKTAVENALSAMQKAEHERRKNAVLSAIESRMNEIRNNEDVEIPSDACDSLKTEEKVEEYAAMEDKDGNFCGDIAAKKDVSSICMDAILSANKAKMNAQRARYAWDRDVHGDVDSEDGFDTALSDILK